MGIAMSHDDSLSYDLNSSTDDKLNGAVSSKSDLKIVNYTNFVKKGKTYCFYLTDLKGNAIANKKLDVKFNGKNYVKTTDAKGMVGINVDLSASSASMEITFKGDDQYNAFSFFNKVCVINNF